MALHKEVCYIKLLQPGALKRGVMQLLKVTKHSHGFDGYLGLCVGHIGLTNMAIAAEKALPMTFEDFATQKASETAGATMTLPQLMEEWRKVNPNPEKPTVVSIRTDGDSTCASSISTNATVRKCHLFVSFPLNALTNSTTTTMLFYQKADGTFGARGMESPGSDDGDFPSPSSNKTNDANPASAVPASAVPNATSGNKRTAASATNGSRKKAKSAPTTKSAPKAPPKSAGEQGSGFKTPRKQQGNKCGLQRDECGLLPGEVSPGRMENGNKCRGCDHSNLFDVRPLKKDYFTKDSIKKPNYPVRCSECERHFVNDAVDLFPRGAACYACPNSINHRDHKCVFTLCHFCYHEKTAADCASDKGKTRRTRRRT